MENYSINPITKKKESIDDIALEAPSNPPVIDGGMPNQPPLMNGGNSSRRSSYLGRILATTLVGLLAYTGLQQKAKADLIWNIAEPTITIEDLIPENPGYEMSITYNVQNQSSTGDPNNLVNFSLTAPSDMRIFYAEGPNETWTYSINPSGTTINFLGNGAYIPPNSSGNFSIFSYHTNTNNGIATAVSDGFTSDPFIPFPDEKEVPIPVIPEPMTIVLMILGGAGASRGLKYYNEHRNKS